MKVEIEIPDLEEFFYSRYYDEPDENINGQDIKKALIDAAISKFVNELYDDYICDNVYTTIKSELTKLISEHQKEIIDNVTNNVTETILKKKAIVDEMPKKSELNNISKEWENYFVELIDKAIAKRFK